MVNISVGGKYFTIQRDNCIPKAYIKAADTLDEYHTSKVVGGCDVAGQL